MGFGKRYYFGGLFKARAFDGFAPGVSVPWFYMDLVPEHVLKANDATTLLKLSRSRQCLDQ